MEDLSKFNNSKNKISNGDLIKRITFGGNKITEKTPTKVSFFIEKLKVSNNRKYSFFIHYDFKNGIEDKIKIDYILDSETMEVITNTSLKKGEKLSKYGFHWIELLEFVEKEFKEYLDTIFFDSQLKNTIKTLKNTSRENFNYFKDDYILLTDINNFKYRFHFNSNGALLGVSHCLSDFKNNPFLRYPLGIRDIKDIPNLRKLGFYNVL